MFDNLNDLVLSATVLAIGGTACLLVGNWLKLHAGLVTALVCWHALLAAFFADYVLVNGGDAFVYYQEARFGLAQLALGTDFVIWLSSFPASLGLGYGPMSFLFNILGTAGLIFFCAAIRDTGALTLRSRPIRLMALLCLFVPSLSFWTSGIGKDALAFLAVGLFSWSAVSIACRQPAAVAAVLIMFAVRPHIAALMVMSIAAGIMFVAEVRATVRFSAATLAAAGALFAVPLALAYAGTGNFDSLAAYISERQEQNLGGGSSIDITGMNPVVRGLSYLFRPLPNEASGFAQLAASLDNLFLAGLMMFGLAGLYRAGFRSVFRRYSIAVIYGLSCLAVLSQVTANLGLASRQKWMLVPVLMIVFLGALTMAKARADRRPVSANLPEPLQASR